MTLHQWVDYCLSKPHAQQDFPFGADTIVFKVGGKMFSLSSVKRSEHGEQKVNLKCEPQRATDLRDQYSSVTPGYHMSKKHWNTVDINEGELSDEEVMKLIDHSYDLVFFSLSKKTRDELSLG